MSEKSEQDQCIWKPSIKRKTETGVKILKFPCRYPEKEKTSDVCTPCLLGDVFTIGYSQLNLLKNQQGMSEEIMTFLRTFTSDDDVNEFK